MNSLPAKSNPLLLDLEVRRRAEEMTKLRDKTPVTLAVARAEGGAEVGLVVAADGRGGREKSNWIWRFFYLFINFSIFVSPIMCQIIID